MRVSLDLNADVGEGFGFDDSLFAIVTSANVACGFHAGDDSTMRAACESAVRHGVAVGAQVSYRDREGFGRRDVEIARADLVRDLAEQVRSLDRAAVAAGTRVRYVKPHGALYNRAAWDPDHAGAVIDTAAAAALPVLGLPGSCLVAAAEARGLAAYREFFADRGYTTDGRLVPRSDAGAVVADAAEVARRVTRLLDSGDVLSVGGSPVAVSADSVCVHGDTPGASALAAAARAAIERAGVAVRAFA